MAGAGIVAHTQSGSVCGCLLPSEDLLTSTHTHTAHTHTHLVHRARHPLLSQVCPEQVVCSDLTRPRWSPATHIVQGTKGVTHNSMDGGLASMAEIKHQDNGDTALRIPCDRCNNATNSCCAAVGGPVEWRSAVTLGLSETSNTRIALFYHPGQPYGWRWISNRCWNSFVFSRGTTHTLEHYLIVPFMPIKTTAAKNREDCCVLFFLSTKTGFFLLDIFIASAGAALLVCLDWQSLIDFGIISMFWSRGCVWRRCVWGGFSGWCWKQSAVRGEYASHPALLPPLWPQERRGGGWGRRVGNCAGPSDLGFHTRRASREPVYCWSAEV